ncbi:MAG: glucose-1-phosphate cytidylyltransferase [Myxococcota bacterium]
MSAGGDPKVVILCGGLGTRLREETEYRPKPMVTIGDRPILWHIMKGFSSHGFRDFVLCLGYKGEKIKEYFYNYDILNTSFTIELGSKKQVEFHYEIPEADWRVTLADTGEHAMTGARVRRVAKYIEGDRFLLTYGDGVSNVDVRRLLEFHRAHGKTATVTGVHPPSRFGELVVDDAGRVLEFAEKPQARGSYINGGFFVCERSFFDYLEDDDSCVLENEPLERLAAAGELMTYRHDGFWACMDTYRDFSYLNDLWSRGEAPWRVWDRAPSDPTPR